MVPRAILCLITWVFGVEKSSKNFEDILEAFELYFKPMQSIYQLWYLLGSCYLETYVNQAAFITKLNEIAAVDLQPRMKW